MGVITCAIFGECPLRRVGVVRGASFPSPIDLKTGHAVTLTRDCVMLRQ